MPSPTEGRGHTDWLSALDIGAAIECAVQRKLKFESEKIDALRIGVYRTPLGKSTPGAAEMGSCLTDATRADRARRTVRGDAAPLRAERTTLTSTRPVDPVEAFRPPRARKGTHEVCAHG